jgi:putative sugar O-methyltransferase
MSTPAMSTSVDGEIADQIEAMRAHVAAGPEIYRPGAFWSDLLETNLEMLRTDGIANFKRTVSNNYFNWMVMDPRDPQFRLAMVRWLRRPRWVRVQMERPEGLRLMSRDDAFGLSPLRSALYRFFVGMAWERAREEDRLGLTERLQEPEAGNPIRMTAKGRAISQDLANSIIECNFAAASGQVRDGARVAELGAGYGRVAHVFSAAADVSYAIFDIPPALAVSQWYLTQVLGAERIVPFSADGDPTTLAPGSVGFYSPDQLERVPDGWFDLTQTISTLPEMPRHQAEHFLGLLADKSSGALFLKQWLRWRNEADGSELAEEGYAPRGDWALTHRRLDPIQPEFFNRLWQRRS